MSIYNGIKYSIPKAASSKLEQEAFVSPSKRLESIVIPFGFNMLLEITFTFINECQKGTALPELRKMTVNQYGSILYSIVESEKVLKDKMDN